MKYLLTLLKTCFFLITVLAASNADAQNKYLKNAVYLNGGVFNGNPTASIGGYNVYQGNYEHFDSVYVESVDDLSIDHIDGNMAYLAAQDTLIQYDLENRQRVNTRLLTQIKWLHVTDDWVFAGRSNFPSKPSPFIEVSHTLSLGDAGFELDSFYDNVNDMAIINDTAYISHNIEKKQSFGDSLGYLAVYDLVNQKFVKHIDLDSLGGGINELYTYENKVYGLARETGNLIEYDHSTGNLTFKDIEVGRGLGIDDGQLYARFFEDGIGQYDLENQEFVDSFIFGTNTAFNFNAAVYDTLSNRFFVAETDYSTYGAGYVYNDTGRMLDSFATNVSPAAIAFQYGTNQAPIAETDYDTLESGETKPVGILANDEDPEAHDLMLSGIAIQGSHGSATVDGDSVYYTADSSYVGNDTVDYIVCDEVGDCDTGKVIFNVEQPSSSLDLVTESQSIEAYPNPVASELNVNLGGMDISDNDRLVLQNLQGRTVMTKTLNANSGREIALDVSELDSGVYLLRIETGNKKVIQKVIKE